MERDSDADSAAASPSSSPSPKGLRTLASFYSSYLWNRLISFFHSLPNFNHALTSIPNLYHRFITRTTSGYLFRSLKACDCLPLPLPSSNSFDSHSHSSPLVIVESSRAHDLLNDILKHLFANIHDIEANLNFWQAKAERSDATKVYFVIFERGPRAFIDGTFQLIRDYFTHGSSMLHMRKFASAHIYERVAALSCLRDSLAAFLAQIYIEVGRRGEELVKDPDNFLPSLLVIINDLFSKFEASIGHLHAMHQDASSADGSYLVSLTFGKFPQVNEDGSQSVENDVTDAIHKVYQNLCKLDAYLSVFVKKHEKPSKITQHWIRYTCATVGLSFCSVWFLRHSRLMGSSDIDDWICKAKQSTMTFFNDHVQEPLLAIRDELFDTFRKRHKTVMELEEVQLTSNSLHRMLLAFSEQSKGEKLPENASDQEMLEIVMTRYEKELVHPIQNLLHGELARSLLIQVQKLKLDIETAMLELDQILRANEINFAILAALPAFFVSLLLLMAVRAWLKQDKRAEGKGRISRIQRRLLIVEVEKRIMQYQNFADQGMEKDAECMFGLILYRLDQLYRAVKRHAQASGEWQCLRQDIIDLSRPGLNTAYKLAVTSRMETVYDCLLPSLRRR